MKVKGKSMTKLVASSFLLTALPNNKLCTREPFLWREPVWRRKAWQVAASGCWRPNCSLSARDGLSPQDMRACTSPATGRATAFQCFVQNRGWKRYSPLALFQKMNDRALEITKIQISTKTDTETRCVVKVGESTWEFCVCSQACLLQTLGHHVVDPLVRLIHPYLKQVSRHGSGANS